MSGIITGVYTQYEAGQAAKEGAVKSADAAADASRENIEFQKWLWGEQKELTQPWVTAGEGGLADYTGRISEGFQYDQYKDPSTQFRFEEGQKAIEHSAAAKGMALSGGGLKDLLRYGQDYASTEYGNAYNRWQNELNNLYNLSAMGQASASGQAVQGGQMGGQVSSSIIGAGQARSQMFSDVGNIKAAQWQAPWNMAMDIGGLASSYYGGGGDGGGK